MSHHPVAVICSLLALSAVSTVNAFTLALIAEISGTYSLTEIAILFFS
jgi:hypothetical protein